MPSEWNNTIADLVGANGRAGCTHGAGVKVRPVAPISNSIHRPFCINNSIRSPTINLKKRQIWGADGLVFGPWVWVSWFPCSLIPVSHSIHCYRLCIFSHLLSSWRATLCDINLIQHQVWCVQTEWWQLPLKSESQATPNADMQEMYIIHLRHQCRGKYWSRATLHCCISAFMCLEKHLRSRFSSSVESNKHVLALSPF